MKIRKGHVYAYLLAVVLGTVTGLLSLPELHQLALSFSCYFVLVMKWLCIPLISLSILATATGLQSQRELFGLGRTVMKYTLSTTLIAATIGMGLFLLLGSPSPEAAATSNAHLPNPGSNVFGLLLVGTVLGSLVLSGVILKLASTLRQQVHGVLSTTYRWMMVGIQNLLKLMPLAIWAFVTRFVVEFNPLTIKSLGLYLACIIAANLIQAMVVLPLFLKWKGQQPRRIFKGMFPALNVAFWSKSSSVALPVAMQCAKDDLKLNPKITQFTLPLCTTVNMNACAAFIIITVLFVTMSHGYTYTPLTLIALLLASTIAAVGNAGVPMGCFTLACAMISYFGMPLCMMGLILPFYAMIDMLESAINVWSDSCVTVLTCADHAGYLAPETESGNASPSYDKLASNR